VRARIIAGLVALGLVAAPIGAAPGQSWRAAALESFDISWQTINDTFHDPTFGGLDWAAVRDQLRPRAEAATSPDEVRAAIRDMLARLGRSHFALISTSTASPGEGGGGEATVAVEMRLDGGRPVITRVEPDSTAAAAGLRGGDAILAVDGRQVETPLPSHDEDPRATLLAWQRVNNWLRGARGSSARLRVAGVGGAEREVVVARERDRGQVVRFGNLPPLAVRTDVVERGTPGDRRVGVIAFSSWMPAAAVPISEGVDRFRQADGLVIDLRGNLGGLVDMVRGVAGHVLDEPVSLGRMQTRGSMLEFRANPRKSTPDGRAVEPFAGPVAVLVDELTASASECFAGGLQSLGRVRVFGRRTAGQALPAATRGLPNGDVLMYVIGDFVTPSGRRLEGDGVMPDQVVPIDREALAAGRDPVLEAALAWVDAEAERQPARHLP
jgi:carboxyl-terminal processing protease